MSLSPNDIRNYSFPNQMRGYDRDEVDSFKDQVAQALESQKQEALKLQMELDSVKSQLAGLKQFEDTIKGAAIDARRNADTLMQNAKKEAEQILSRAREEADRLIEAKTQQCGHLDQQIEKLDLAKKSYLNKLKQLIGGHFELLDEIASAEPPERPSVPQPQMSAQPQAQQHEQEQQQEPKAEAKAEVSATGAIPTAAASKPKPEHEIEVTDSSEMRETTRETVATQPSKNQGIRTEEANAADEIVSMEQAKDEDHDLTDSLRKVVRDEQAQDNQGADEDDQDEASQDDQSYNGHSAQEDESATEKGETDLPDEPQQDQPDPKQAAEQGVIDPDLAAALEKYQHQNPAAKTKTAGTPESQEPNAVDTPKQGEVVETEASADEPSAEFVPVAEAPENESSSKDRDESGPMDPNDLASTLDSVAKKFEEEMDRADNK